MVSGSLRRLRSELCFSLNLNIHSSHLGDTNEYADSSHERGLAKNPNAAKAGYSVLHTIQGLKIQFYNRNNSITQMSHFVFLTISLEHSSFHGAQQIWGTHFISYIYKWGLQILISKGKDNILKLY